MAKGSKKPSRRSRAQENDFEGPTPLRDFKNSKATKSATRRAEEAWTRKEAKPLVCKNQKQKEYLNTIRTNQITFGVGPAGTGKSYVALKFAALEFDAGRIEKIIITRPAVEAGGGLGFLPGTVDEKIAPYAAPMLDILGEHFGKSHLENLMGGPYPKVSFIPMEFLRGKTISDGFILLDEAQNATIKQTQTLLTRIGPNTRVVINGDIEQIDIKVTDSGLPDALKRFKDSEKFGIVEFDVDDIVRSDIVRDVILAYRKHI